MHPHLSLRAAAPAILLVVLSGIASAQSPTYIAWLFSSNATCDTIDSVSWHVSGSCVLGPGAAGYVNVNTVSSGAVGVGARCLDGGCSFCADTISSVRYGECVQIVTGVYARFEEVLNATIHVALHNSSACDVVDGGALTIQSPRDPEVYVPELLSTLQVALLADRSTLAYGFAQCLGGSCQFSGLVSAGECFLVCPATDRNCYAVFRSRWLTLTVDGKSSAAEPTIAMAPHAMFVVVTLLCGLAIAGV